MTLDKNKKYEFAGDVYEYICGDVWFSRDSYGWTHQNFEFLANKGLVKEVREPIVGRGRIIFDESGLISSRMCERFGISLDQAAGRTYDIVATEVVE